MPLFYETNLLNMIIFCGHFSAGKAMGESCGNYACTLVLIIYIDNLVPNTHICKVPLQPHVGIFLCICHVCHGRILGHRGTPTSCYWTPSHLPTANARYFARW